LVQKLLPMEIASSTTAAILMFF